MMMNECTVAVRRNVNFVEINISKYRRFTLSYLQICEANGFDLDDSFIKTKTRQANYHNIAHNV